MILECPACHARFMVADAQIPAEGRTVRCGRCAHEWHVEKPYESAALDSLISVTEVEPITPHDAGSPPVDEAFLAQLEAVLGSPVDRPTPQRHNLPAIKRLPRSAKPYKIAVPLIAATWLILAFIAYFPKWSDAPVLRGIYHAMGVTNTEGLVFSDVTMEREQEGSKTKFILSGSISNHTNIEKAVPTVRVSLRDKNDKSIWGRSYPVNTTLKAGEVYPFRITNVETNFASSVSSIVVDMGNSLQLLVR